MDLRDTGGHNGTLTAYNLDLADDAGMFVANAVGFYLDFLLRAV